MFSRIHIIAVVACVGIGMGTVPQFSLASSSNLGRDLLAFFRPNHGPVATNDVPSNTAAAVFHLPSLLITSAALQNKVTQLLQMNNFASSTNPKTTCIQMHSYSVKLSPVLLAAFRINLPVRTQVVCTID